MKASFPSWQGGGGNSWGGPSQALTALRAPRWMERYAKAADLAHLMKQWTSAIVRSGKFLQQMNPLDGAFTMDTGDYSPAALVFIDFTWRLSGVRRTSDGFEWNLRPPARDTRSRFRLQATPTRVAEIQYAAGRADVFVNDKLRYRTGDIVRLITDLEGNLQSVTGIADTKANVTLETPSGESLRLSLEPNKNQRARA